MVVVGVKEVEFNSLSICICSIGELGSIFVMEVIQKMIKAIVNYENFQVYVYRKFKFLIRVILFYILKLIL